MTQATGRSFATELREQGRGVVGALLVVGVAAIYTMETWWLSWELPVTVLILYAFVGLGAVLLVTREVGFSSEDEEGTEHDPVRLAVRFTELLVQSFVTAYVTLYLFGILTLGDPLPVVARMGLFLVVPLGLGAGLANRLLAQSDEGQAPTDFPGNLALFGLGAVFFTFPIAPTEEVALIAVKTGWVRTALVVVLSVLLVHLILYHLEFRGQRARIENRSSIQRWETTFIAYLVGTSLSVVLLAVFGHFSGTTITEGIQLVVVLGFLASIGAAAGDVVL